MLGDKKSALNNPRLMREEAILRQKPVKKSKGWLFKLILILIVIGIVYFLFTRPDIIMNPVNKFFERFS